MTTPPPRGLKLVFDAGPILCLGGAPGLRKAVREAWYGHACWVEAVHKELKRLAQKHDSRGRAAQAMTGTRNRWLGVPVPLHPADAPYVDIVHQQVRALDKSPTGDDHHAGEVYSILHARRTSLAFVTNDGGAKTVANRHRIATVNAIDLARALVADRAGNPRLLYDDLATLESRGITTGRPQARGPLDLAPPRARR